MKSPAAMGGVWVAVLGVVMTVMWGMLCVWLVLGFFESLTLGCRGGDVV
jgi:hypothetical protein